MSEREAPAAPRDERVAELWWTARGAAVAPSLIDAHAIVVVGDDPVAAAQAALGLARAESPRRRVAVADLVGDVAPLQSLVEGEDPHGVVDSFLYGVSLNRVARPVDASGNLFVIPSGTEPVLTEEIFRSERWRRLAAGFAEAEALLVLVAPTSAPGLDDLIAMVDGAVVVGDAALGASTRVLAVIPPPPPAAVDDVLDAPSRKGGRRPRAVPREAGSPPWLTPALLGTLLVGLAAAYFTHKPDPPRKTSTAKPVATAPAAAPAVAQVVVPLDSAAAATPAPVVENPSDSAVAMAYAVAILAANTQAGAEHELEVRGASLPAATVSPVVYPDNVQWYRLYAGAFPTRAGADSLRAQLEKSRASAPGSVSVVRAPFALLLQRGVSTSSVEYVKGGLAASGVHPYGLKQQDGTINLYVGAFERPEQSAVLADMLRARRLTPALVYRTGTPY